MNEQLARIARAAEGYPAGLATYRDGPAKPDFPLKEVTNRVIAQMGPYPDGDADRQGYFRRLNLEIADKIRLDDLTIWARYADFPVKHIDQADLEHVIVNVVKDVISIPNDWNTLVYTDVQFVKVEVDRVWPKPLETTNDASP